MTLGGGSEACGHGRNKRARECALFHRWLPLRTRVDITLPRRIHQRLVEHASVYLSLAGEYLRHVGVASGRTAKLRGPKLRVRIR